MTAETPRSYFDTSSEAQRERSRRGRKTGSRAKLAQRFFEDIYAAWEEQGPSVLARAAFHDPVSFANMVARLMPQKIEVSTPTDGLSDERLAEMLEFAERMAGLKAAQAKVIQGEAVTPHQLDHEKPETALLLEGGGGGPLREEGGGGIYTPHTTPAAPAKSAETDSNGLNTPYPVGRAVPLQDHVVEKQNRHNLIEPDTDPESLF